jgi:hypothetical protein
MEKVNEDISKIGLSMKWTGWEMGVREKSGRSGVRNRASCVMRRRGTMRQPGRQGRGGQWRYSRPDVHLPKPARIVGFYPEKESDKGFAGHFHQTFE